MASQPQENWERSSGRKFIILPFCNLYFWIVQILDKEKQIELLQKVYEDEINTKKLKDNEVIQAKEKLEEENKKFWDELQISEDLNDNLT